MPAPSRREVLAAASSLSVGALAGCTGLNPFAEKGMDMTVVRADGTETDTKCDLPDETVAQYPALLRAFDRLADAEDGTTVRKKLATEKGAAIGNMLTRQCEDVGGLYKYRGVWYLVGLSFDSQEDHDRYENGSGHSHNDTTTEQTG